MQGDGSSVVYGPTGPIWSSGANVPGARLLVQDDGNVASYAPPDGRSVWAADTNWNPGASVVAGTLAGLGGSAAAAG
jgi:hypothetical protein